MRVIIDRYFSDDKHTIGTCTVLNKDGVPIFTCSSLERGWLDNKPNESCAPKGEYSMVLEYSPKFNQQLWELKDIPNRSEIKFHASNFWYELNGCIALGRQVLFLNDDKEYDVSRSRDTMNLFHEVLRPMNGKIVTVIIK